MLRRLLLKQPICRRCVCSWEVLLPLFSTSCQQWRKHCHCGYRASCALRLFSAFLPIMMWLTLIRAKLLSCDLRLHQYSFDRFCHPFAVYIKLPILWRIPTKTQSVQQSKWSYVGSTAVGVTAREHNRRAKLKQVLNGQFVQVEPAVRFWAAKGNYSKFTIIVLHTFPDYRSAWIREHALIGLWQPRLNRPFLHRFLVKRAAGHKVIKLRNTSGRPPPNFRRLFLRLCRRSTTVQKHSLSLIAKERAFAVLFDLAKDDVRSVEACKLIRSNKFTDSEVYTLWRIARALERPMISKVLRAVRSALKFRNCSVPPGQTPLGLPLFAHHSFSTNAQVWLRSKIIQYKHWLIHRCICLPVVLWN